MPDDLPETWNDDEYVRQLMRHVVPVHFEFQKGNETTTALITSFVFSVEERWIVMTAGHCIKDVAKFRESGWRLNRAALLDSLGTEAIHHQPVPFDYDNARPTVLWPDPMYDYGVMIPSLLESWAMTANGVTPMGEDAWDQDLPHVDRYKFLGIPDARVFSVPPNRKQLTMLLPTVDRISAEEAIEEGFAPTTAPMFYGRLRDDPQTKLFGMSGGPIFAFMDDPTNGQERYQLVAMQVSALRNKYISGVMMRPLGEFLRERVREQRAKNEKSGCETSD
jgi:hypothetical protein